MLRDKLRREYLIEEEMATKECLGLKAEEYAEGDDANKLLEMFRDNYFTIATLKKLEKISITLT